MSERYSLIAPFKLVLLVTLSLVLVCTVASRRGDPYRDLSQEPPLRLELGLKLYKKTFLFREPVWVKVSVTNVGEHSGMFTFETGEALVITDSVGITYSPNVHFGRGMSEIEAGETWQHHLSLSTFGYGSPHSEKVKGYWYLPVGRYTIRYQLNQSGVSGGRLDVESSTDTFWVLEARNEDAEALKLLIESYDLHIQKKYDEAIQRLQGLVEKYPNSPYVPWAMREVAVTPDAYREIIRKYPYSGEAVQAVVDIAGYFMNKKDKQGYVDAMNSLISEYPNTEIARAAERRLANIQDRFFQKKRKPDAEDHEEGEQ
jgi:hypothetical protein